ncbi:MAG TPA: hypothetical protein VF121_02960 [Thermoanaerobaculia bacterium]|nr:hypothetical protein [Thermoanaerobaculia bacterium]
MPSPPSRRTSRPAPLLALVASLLAALPALAVPPPPAARADRFGVYHWGADYSAWPGTPDRLNWGAEKAAALGSRTLRVFLGANEFYRVNPADNPRDDGFLRRVAESPAYARLFADPRFRTYLVTVYPPAAFAVWRDGFDAAEAASEREQVARLGAALLRNPAHAGKSFVLLNWEGDHGTGTLPPGDPRWDAFAAWVQARADGVRDARTRAPGSSARLFSGLEFNLVDAWSEAEGRMVRCGEAGTRCVVDEVAPRVDVDYYSYSAWQSLNVKLADPNADLRQRLGEDLAFALAAVRTRRPEVGPASFILGELGFARSLYGECAAARHLEEALAAAEAAGVSYAVVWQALDNRWRVEDGAERTLTDCEAPEWLLYGLHGGSDGRRTLLGTAFAAFLRGARPAFPARCPQIAARGVLNPEARWTARFAPGSPLAVFGSGFSQRGNRVHVLQADVIGDDVPDPNVRLTLASAATTAASGAGSPQRLDARLPAGVLHDGCALVWVTTAAGLDSNARLVAVRAPSPPRPERSD